MAHLTSARFKSWLWHLYADKRYCWPSRIHVISVTDEHLYDTVANYLWLWLNRYKGYLAKQNSLASSNFISKIATTTIYIFDTRLHCKKVYFHCYPICRIYFMCFISNTQEKFNVLILPSENISKKRAII